jgi:hypothetical protein
MNNLAGVLNSQGKSEAARDVYKRVLGLSKKMADPDHRATLTIMDNFVALLDSQGKYEAVRMLRYEMISWAQW